MEMLQLLPYLETHSFYKKYLFGFETLVFATVRILNMYNQLVTLQR